jgi:hypothetical protein
MGNLWVPISGAVRGKSDRPIQGTEPNIPQDQNPEAVNCLFVAGSWRGPREGSYLESAWGSDAHFHTTLLYFHYKIPPPP